MVPHRNIFAHLEVDFSKSSLNEGFIAFKKYKNGKLDLKSYKKDDVIKLNKEFTFLHKALSELLKTPPNPEN